MAWRKERIDRPIKVLTDDIYALSSIRNVLYIAVPRLLPSVLLLLLPILVPSPYIQRVIILTAIYALLALSWDFLASSTGLVSLGQSLFFGVGAYLSGILNLELGLSMLPTLILSTFIGAAICTVFVIPCLPLRGIYFAMTTLIYPLLMIRTIEATAILGGTDGMLGIAPFPNAGLEQYLVLVILLLAMFSLRRLMTTDFGIVLRAIGDNDQAVKASGINIALYKIISVYIASAIGAFAGAYFTHLYMFVGLSAFSLELSIIPIACAVLGGMGTLAGPVLGAFILIPLGEGMREFGTLRMVFYSLFLILFVLIKPEGILSYLQRKYQQIERLVEV
jgi:branched-chain amino acid transport system permease protein